MATQSLEEFLLEHPQANHSSRVFRNSLKVDSGNWNHIADINGMLNSLWGFLQRSVRPALNGESGPSLSVPTTSVVFASQVDVGKESEIYNLVLTNTGDAELVLTDPIVDGDFKIVP